VRGLIHRRTGALGLSEQGVDTRPAASAMAVCCSRAPDLAWTVAELRPLSVVVARLSWFSTSAVIDATSMHVDARRPRAHHPSQYSDSSLC
jgi:hypothetical protein